MECAASYEVFSRDVTAVTLVSQNNETAAMLVSQTSPVGVELFSYANPFFCSDTKSVLFYLNNGDRQLLLY